MCVMPNCPHFDGAHDYKERQKTRFSHSGRGNQRSRMNSKPEVESDEDEETEEDE